MKRVLKIITAAALLVMAMSTAAFAQDAVVKATTAVGSNVSFTAYDKNNSVLTGSGDTYADPAYYAITYTDANITEAGQYMVFQVKASNVSAEGGDYTISESSLIYINQTSGNTGGGSVTFDKVYPMNLTDSYIIISGTGLASPVIVIYVDAQGIILGDVNGSDKADSTDAVLILKYVVGSLTAADINTSLGDVNNSGSIDSTDAVLILKYVVGTVDSNFRSVN